MEERKFWEDKLYQKSPQNKRSEIESKRRSRRRRGRRKKRRGRRRGKRKKTATSGNKRVFNI